MDVRKLDKHTPVDTPRPPLVPAERNDNAAEAPNRRPRTREVTSRYKSPSPSTPSVSRRCPSPTLSRTLPVSSQVVPKRAQSAERRRPSKPSSPPSPSSTPVRDSSVDGQLSSRRLSMGSRLPEGLWPSTMRSLSVSFQSDTISIPVSKKEKPVSSVSSDRTLRPPSNVAQKQGELASRSRKSTPERKGSPLKGKNVQDQAENAKPPDVLHTRLIDQHRWPSRTGAKVSSISLNKSVDLTEKTVKPLSTPAGISLSSLRRNLISDGMHGMHKPLQKSSGDATRLLSAEFGRVGSKLNPVDDSLALLSEVQKLVSNDLSNRTSLTNPSARSHSLPSSGSRPASPSRTSASRGVSPARPRPTTPPSRGVSPSRIRSSTGSNQSSTSSVLSFMVDVKKGKKGAGYIEEAHQLRLLYNRYLQWRFANARAESVLFILKVTAEKTLYNVWEATLSLWDSVFSKRVNLQQLNLDLKLNVILNGQMGYLDEWALIGRDHLNSLSGAVQDLQASTLRLPVTGGAKVDIETLRVAVCSAVDVMQAMWSSMCSLLSRVEDMNALVSDLAVVAARERTMLDECEALLASTAAMQVEDYSNRTHLLQIKDVC